MKKFLDLVLILLVLGTPVFLFVVLPDREGKQEAPPPLASKTRDLLSLPEPPPGDSPSEKDPAPVAVSSTDEAPEVAVVPPPFSGRLALRGFLYRGGSSPMSGEVPIHGDGIDCPDADRNGQFSLVLEAGTFSLGGAGVAGGRIGGLQIPAVEGSGYLSVHRYYRGEEGELISPSAALLLQSNALGKPRLLVRGTSRLPDGAEIAVRLVASSLTLDSTLLRVQDGEFGGELPLSDTDFHAGVYTLQFAWGPELATQPIRKLMVETEWGELQGEVQRDLGVFFGTPMEEKAQQRELLGFYRAALDELEGTRDFMLVVGAQARGKRNKLLDDAERAARIRGNPLAKLHKGLFAGKTLRIDEWRELIDLRVPELANKYANLESIPYVAKEPHAAYHLVVLAQQIVKHAKLESRLVYDALGLGAHPGNYVADYDFPPEVEKRHTIQKIRGVADSIRAYLEIE